MSSIISKRAKNNIVPVICGPTASGKTEFSIKFCNYFSQFLECEIISADSRQVYKNLAIGTAKITEEEKQSIPHHLIDFLDLDAIFSSGKFAEKANELIEQINGSDKLAVIAGGTGFYISSLFDGLDSQVERSSEVKDYISKLYENLDREELYNRLLEIDSKAANKYSDKNPVRVLRALEYYHQTGHKYSDLFEKSDPNIKHNAFYIISDYILAEKRDELYQRINKRCENMWNQGLIEETNNALNLLNIKLEDIIVNEVVIKDLPNSLNTVGYKEVILYLKGQLNEDDALELFKRNTRRYAKRQITWFRKIHRMNEESSVIINYDEENVCNRVYDIIESKINQSLL